ncbi:uncharacterized protein [Epargyreus clarus]|uniref:uncharacterized protein n=1 Tax=Epargyreus clarus TaxID=520877 RepID=UPI003C2D41F1
MKIVVAVLAAASVVYGIQYDGLRVRFGWSNALADKTNFFTIPRTMREAEGRGWRRREMPPGNTGMLRELRLYCPYGRGVCSLYDANGFIAGIQIAIPVPDLTTYGMTPDKLHMVRWSPPPTEEDSYTEYWTATQYFVSEESLKAGAGPQVENGATLQDGGVWVTGPDKKLMRIPTTEAELNTTAFKKQNCVPNMGTHYFYNMTTAMRCENYYPWFAMTTKGDLVATGFSAFARLNRQYQREWFERAPANRERYQILTPRAPDCFFKWAGNYSSISLHIYYVDKPWEIQCRTGDSIQIPSLDNRLLFNVFKFMNKVYDEIKLWFYQTPEYASGRTGLQIKNVESRSYQKDGLRPPFKPGLRAKFSVGLFPGRDFFFDIPRKIADAVAHDWTPRERPETSSSLASLVMYCYDGNYICAMYDPDTEFVAGLQVSLPLNEFTDAKFDWEVQGFKPWTPSVDADAESVTYMIKELYFISEATLMKNKEERLQVVQSDEILTEDAVWVTGFNGDLMKIPTTETGIANSGFTEQACIVWMGRHYYYNMSSATECTSDSILNWFPLVDGGKLIAMGFMVVGVLPEKSGQRFWFERPATLAVKTIVPRGPTCLYDLADDPTVTTMHIYFIDSPWTIGCPLW